MENKNTERKETLLSTVLTNESTSFENTTRTLIDEANELHKPFGERLDDISKKIIGYDLRIKIANTTAG